MNGFRRFGLIFLVACMLLLLLLLLVSCDGGTALQEKNIYAMDTIITLKLYTDSATAQSAYEKASETISGLEAVLSRTRDGSECSLFNNASALYYQDADFSAVLSRALEIAAATDGAYDPTVASLTDLWRIMDPEATGLPTDAEIVGALSHVGYTGITVGEDKLEKNDTATKIDLGGIGKGYACARVVNDLRTSGVAFGLVSFGGNVAVFGKKPDGEPFRVSLRDPADENGTVGTVTLTEGFVSVSGSYERYREVDGVRYHHIFDPATGRPAQSGLVSVAVLSRDGALADALSTALFVMGAEKGYSFWKSGIYDFEAVFITADGDVILTDGLADGRFSLSDDRYHLAKIGGTT